MFNGEIIKGQLGVPDSGEIWDLPYKGKMLEEWAGTTKAMVQIYESLGGIDNDIKNGNIRQLAGIAGDTNHHEYYLAQTALKEFGGSLGAALAYACSEFRPESFLLAGNIAKAFDLFDREVTVSYLSNASFRRKRSVFKQSRLIDRNGLLGAAYIAFAGMMISTY